VSGSVGKLSAAKRRQKRVKMVLAVRICGVDAKGNTVEQLAHTTDITFDGARVAGLRTELTKGQSVIVHRGGVKRTFRVVWVAAAGNEFQIGLQAVEPLKELWKLDLPLNQDEYVLPAKAGR
jgi:hypothetical protein